MELNWDRIRKNVARDVSMVLVAIGVVTYLVCQIPSVRGAGTVTPPACRHLCREQHFDGWVWTPTHTADRRFPRGTCACTGSDR